MLTGVVIIAIYNILINHRRNKMENTSKIKSFKIYTDDTNDGVEEKVLVGNDIDTALEILENNGYIIEVEYK